MRRRKPCRKRSSKSVADSDSAVQSVPPWWPHAARSRCLDAGALRWHLQQWPHQDSAAPVALLLHGTGAATHTWRHVAPLLAERFHVVAPDLPGHGFTSTPAQQALTLPGVAQAVGDLLGVMQLRPTLVVGHSAGAAIAMRMVLDDVIAPTLTVSIAGAILPLQGPIGRLFLPLARVLANNPFVPPAFAAMASLPSVARRLLASTGSRIDAEGERCYAHLVANATHAAGALRLMASWDLQPLADDLARWRAPLLLIAGVDDRTLPAAHSQRVQAIVGEASSRCVVLPRLGHLAHEEDAAAVLTPLWQQLDQTATTARRRGRAAPLSA
jgi:magnesium chelatase accessory protein